MYRQKMRTWFQHADFILIDQLCLFLALVLSGVFSNLDRAAPGDDERALIITILAVNLLVSVTLNTMDNVVLRGKFREFAAVARQAVITLACAALAVVLWRETVRVSRVRTLLLVMYYIASTFAARQAWKLFLRKHPRRDPTRKSILVVTDTASAPLILGRLADDPSGKSRVAGVVLIDRDARGEDVGGYPVVANLDGAADYICREWVDEVFFFHASLDARAQDLLDRCREMALTVHLYIGLQGVEEHKQIVQRIAGFEVLTVNVNMISAQDAALKRLFDLAVGLVGSLAALVVMAALAPAILIQSPGPLIYAQERIGENGRRFRMYKIRSMHIDADRQKAALDRQNSHGEGGMMFKMDFDPRVIGNAALPDGTHRTGVGAFIRRSSIDEMPQFFNVLRGEMSMVGTRPPTVDEWEKYQYRHRARMSIRPGMTGLWQVSPEKDSMPFDEVVRLDTEYIANWSIGLDLRILFKTASAVLRGIFAR